jgi:acyl-coenzyme A thioesterase PaaI-like protein
VATPEALGNMKAIQDQLPDNHCYGCGPDNPAGMQIKSYFDGEFSRCTYSPKPEQCAGPKGFVYGGTIASLVDCHCIGTAIAAYYRDEDREIGTGEAIWCVTGKLLVDYRKPTPIDVDISLIATVRELGPKKAVLTCDVLSGETLTARGEVVAVRVPPEWTQKA